MDQNLCPAAAANREPNAKGIIIISKPISSAVRSHHRHRHHQHDTWWWNSSISSLLVCVILQLIISSEVSAFNRTSQPLVYTRLRHDLNYLQLMRNLQLSNPIDELPLTSNVSAKSNKKNPPQSNTSLPLAHNKPITYFENAAIDERKLTHNDLVFEALDQTYKSRLVPAYIYNYDKLTDLKESSDASLVSESRCFQELDFLLKSLSHWRRTRNEKYYQSSETTTNEDGEEDEGGANAGTTSAAAATESINPELAAFFDSYASEEPGVLFGNYHWTGNWRQCSKRHLFRKRSQPSSSGTESNGGGLSFTGRYCIASISSNSWHEKIQKQRVKLEEKNYFKYAGQQHDYVKFFRIQVGLCLPESCDSQILHTMTNDSSLSSSSFRANLRENIRKLALLKLNPPYTSYKLDDLFCLPDESSKLRQISTLGWLLIFFAVCWCLLVALATYADYYSSSSSSFNCFDCTGSEKRNSQLVAPSSDGQLRSESSILQRFISCLSLGRNLNRLLECGKSSNLKTNKNTTTNVDERLKDHKEPPNAEPAHAGMKEEEKEEEMNKEDKRRPAAARQKQQHQEQFGIEQLQFLNSFKVFAMLALILGHCGLFLHALGRFPLDDSLPELLFHFQASTPMCVDWFFAISGFLVTWSAFSSERVRTNSPTQWLYTIFHRYWRLAPTYWLLLAFARSLFHLTGSGPMWDYGVSNMTFRGICQRRDDATSSWLWLLRPLTLTQNFHPIHEECIMPSWYLADDFQFYLITPLLLILLSRKPLTGWLLVLSLISSSVALTLHRYLSPDSPAQHLELMRPRSDLLMRNNWDMHQTYLYPQYRIAPYLVGILAGHLSYMVLVSKRWSFFFFLLYNKATVVGKSSSSKWSSSSLGRVIRSLGWFAGLLLLIQVSFFSTWFISNFFPIIGSLTQTNIKFGTSIAYSFSHLLAGFALCLVVVTFLFGQFPALKLALSHPKLTLISKLNYIVFLIHCELIQWLMQSEDRAPDLGTKQIIKLWLLVTGLSYCLAFVLTLLIELPLAQLEREFIGKTMMSRSKSNNNNNNKNNNKNHIAQNHWKPAAQYSSQKSNKQNHCMNP